jgi:hypothetical protein
MEPSEANIASFIAFAPNATEGEAFMFLEASHPYGIGLFLEGS